MISSNTKVNDFLVEVQSTFPDSFEIIEAIQTLFFEENSQLIDDIKYGGVVFNNIDKLIGGIYLYKTYLSIEFSHGATFKDPTNALEGKGKLRRHLKIYELEDLKSKDAHFFIKQAAKIT